MAVEFRYFNHGDIRLHHAVMGAEDAPVMLLLHGFPEYWAAWEEVMPLLAKHYRVIVPDQRGFNLSSKPADVGAYQTKLLVADMVALARHYSPDAPIILVGHDWGSAIAYAMAFAVPELISQLVIVNGVHPACFQRAILFDPAQREASQYMNWLQREEATQELAEENYRRLLSMLENFSATDWLTAQKRQAYINAWAQPGAMRGMTNWYRASPVIIPAIDEVRETAPVLTYPKEMLQVKMPHLLIWAEDDQALRPSCIADLRDYADELTVHRIKGHGHWVLHERPEEITQVMVDFLDGHSAA